MRVENQEFGVVYDETAIVSGLTVGDGDGDSGGTPRPPPGPPNPTPPQVPPGWRRK